MTPWLRTIDTWFETHWSEFYDQLNPGATDDERSRAEAHFGIRMSPDWHSLYGWRNGQMDENRDAFYLEYEYLSLKDSIRAWDTLHDLLPGFDHNWWRPAWIPFLGSLTGDYLCIDMEGSFEGDPGQIISFIHDDTLRVIAFPSLDALGEVFAKTLDDELWVVDHEEGSLMPSDNEKGYAWPIEVASKELFPAFPRVVFKNNFDL